jgi:chromosome segregation ATPase
MNENAWKSAARAWWERLNDERATVARERLKNAELLQKIEELQAALKKSHEHGWNMNRTVEQTMREHDSMRNELERVVLLEKRTRTELEQLQKGAESLQKEPCDDCETWRSRALRAEEKYDHQRDAARKAYCQGFADAEVYNDRQPSSNPGDFAALAERIAKADGKHPRDSRDMEERAVEPQLQYSRARLRDAPTWENALRCELDEVLIEFWRGDHERAADELLDVAVVAVRWRRAVLERGSK